MAVVKLPLRRRPSRSMQAYEVAISMYCSDVNVGRSSTGSKGSLAILAYGDWK